MLHRKKLIPPPLLLEIIIICGNHIFVPPIWSRIKASLASLQITATQYSSFHDNKSANYVLARM